LQESLTTKPEQYKTLQIGNIKIVQTQQSQYVIPNTLVQQVLEFYHTNLNHPGATRMYATMRNVLSWPKMKAQVEQYALTCATCQLNKRGGKLYGHIPPSNPELIPWRQVNIDLIGPYSQTGTNDGYYAITMIEPVIRWIEIHPIKPKTSLNVAQTFDDNWLCRYPRPLFCVFDNGKEFMGQEFQEMLESYGITPKPTTIKNPQANAILERVHGVVGNMLRTTNLTDELWHAKCQAIAFAIRATYHINLQASPAQLLFHRDMIMDVTYKADIQLQNERRLQQIQIQNALENSKRIQHTYKIGDYVLLDKGKPLPTKLESKWDGPFKILKVRHNGTVVIQRHGFSQVVSIRRLRPFRMGENDLSQVEARSTNA
jgi:hypothetical protein